MGDAWSARYPARASVRGGGQTDLLLHVVDAAPVAIVVVNADGKLVSVNAQAETLFGYSRTELLGESVDLLVPMRFRDGHPLLRESFIGMPTTRPMGAGRDLFGARKDGSEVPIEIGLNPIGTDDGLFILAAIIDITERKHAEEHQRLIVEAAPNAMVMIDDAGRIAMANAETENLFGYDRAELLGLTVEMLVPERFRLGHPAMRRGFLAAPSARRMLAGRDLFGLRKDGSEVPIEIRLNPIMTPAGQFVLAAIIDMTERLRAEELRILNAGMQQHNEQLASLNKELESFSYSVSHDLRAPVRAISGYAQAIAEDYSDRFDEEGLRLLGVIQAEAARMGKLIDGLLEFARLGREPVENGPVDMATIARDVARALPETKPVAIEIGEIPPARGDATLLRQVWANLLSNAAKYSGKRAAPVVRVWGNVEHGEAVYHVADNGVGFDMRYADKLFGVFQRLHHADEFSGTGIGLATVSRIVTRHGGRVWASSTLGEGAQFSFALPSGAR